MSQMVGVVNDENITNLAGKTRMKVAAKKRVATAYAASKRELLLRTLSAAMAKKPNATFPELAAEAGISRATLYRIASSRNELLMILTRKSVELAQEALQRADVPSKDPATAFEDLTAILVQDGQFYLHFVVGSPEFSPKLVAPGLPKNLWSFYNNAVVDLFRRGQQQGCFRTDFPPLWLRWMYDALLLAAVIADLNGELASADRVRFIVQSFLHGAAAAPEPVATHRSRKPAAIRFK